MAGEIVLAGGDEFRSGCEEMDSYILRVVGLQPPRVLVLPTAAVTGPQKAAADGVRHFSRLGALASELMVLERAHAEDEDLVQLVVGTSLIYFTGGSPEHLLATLRDSKLLGSLEKEKRGGAVVGGSSAGAMVMGSFMKLPSSGEWVRGLGIAEGLGVLPHHERSDPAAVSGEVAATAPPGLKVLGIDAQTCCFGNPGNWTVLGCGRVTAYDGTSWQVFNPGDVLPSGF